MTKKSLWLLAIIPMLCVTWYAHAAYLAKGNGQFVDVTINPGTSGSAVVTQLEKQGIVTSDLAARIYLKLHGGGEHFQSGVFHLERGASIATTLTTISSPAAVKEKVLRVIEGWNLYDIAREVQKLGIGTGEEFLKVTGKPATDYRKVPQFAPSIDWSKEFPILADKPKYVSLEGYIFPDTYRFAVDAKPEDVVRKLLKEFTIKFDTSMIAKAKAQNKSVFQIVTMASVVEKEVSGNVDRAKVADMLWRRNDINWALQCDSTVKYAAGKFDDTPFTTAADRASQSEYNTYQFYGLPLGPISNPGLVSLSATLNPQKNDFWYFLTTPDGEVKYARSLEEQAANKKYMR